MFRNMISRYIYVTVTHISTHAKVVAAAPSATRQPECPHTPFLTLFFLMHTIVKYLELSPRFKFQLVDKKDRQKILSKAFRSKCGTEERHLSWDHIFAATTSHNLDVNAPILQTNKQLKQKTFGPLCCHNIVCNQFSQLLCKSTHIGYKLENKTLRYNF